MTLSANRSGTRELTSQKAWRDQLKLSKRAKNLSKRVAGACVRVLHRNSAAVAMAVGGVCD